jgi:hypothetical protein
LLVVFNFIGSGTNSIPEEPKALALYTRDLYNKKIISTPSLISGRLTDIEPVIFIFYLHNPTSYTLNTTTLWWLGQGLNAGYVFVNYNVTNILTPNSTVECMMTFSLKTDMPAIEVEKFKMAGNNILYFDIKSKVLEE